MNGQELREVFQWDVRSWARALPLWDKYLGRGAPGQALAIGERDGGLSLLLARRGYAVLCTDLDGPTEVARELHRSAGLGHRVTYAAQDVTALDLPDDRFDVVVFKSVIGALGDTERQRRALGEIHRVLRPGGVLLFAENLSGTALHRWLRKRFIPWDSYWRYLRLPGDLDLFSAFGTIETRTTGFLANLGRSECQRDLLARLDAVLLPFVPAGCRYILFGVARKA